MGTIRGISKSRKGLRELLDRATANGTALECTVPSDIHFDLPELSIDIPEYELRLTAQARVTTRYHRIKRWGTPIADDQNYVDVNLRSYHTHNNGYVKCLGMTSEDQKQQVFQLYGTCIRAVEDIFGRADRYGNELSLNWKLPGRMFYDVDRDRVEFDIGVPVDPRKPTLRERLTGNFVKPVTFKPDDFPITKIGEIQ